MNVQDTITALKIEIKVLENMIAYNKDFEPKNDCTSLKSKKNALEMAIEALEKQIPKQPIIKDWDYARCPTCGAGLSQHLGDGYYKHYTHWEYCHNPDCLQRLCWESEE